MREGELSAEIAAVLNLDPVVGTKAHIVEVEDPTRQMNADGHNKEVDADMVREVNIALKGVIQPSGVDG